MSKESPNLGVRKEFRSWASYFPSRHRQRGIHWRVPTVMLGSLLAGTAAALGHHLFYMHYNNRPVQSITEQRYLSNGGTGFAFLVKMFLAIATGTAYVQLFWLSLRNKAYALERVDKLYSVLGNVTVFWDLGLWLRNPILAALAIVTWMLPLAVIITPGTLTVQTTSQTSYIMTTPPQLSLDANKYAVYALGDNDESPMDLQGPLSAVTASTVASMAQQVVLPISHTHPNSSYHLQFDAPAMQCTEPSQSNITAFQRELLDAINLGYLPGRLSADDSAQPSSLIFNAWAPDETNHPDLSNPNWNNGSSNYIDTTYGLYLGATLFVYIAQVDSNGLNKNVLSQCTLYNATYDVDFNFSGGDQNVHITSVNYHGASPVVLMVLYCGGNPSCAALSDPGVTYTSIMWAFSQVLVGTGTSNPAYQQDVPNYTGTLAQITALDKFIEGPEVLEFDAVKTTLEQMFHNMTLSLLSSNKLLLNGTAQQQVNTTTLISEPRYLYQPTNVYIAYGSGILSALICVVIGCAALINNDVSYSNDFTTVIRTTRRREMTDLVTPKDSIGGDSLDKGIGKAIVTFHARKMNGSYTASGNSEEEIGKDEEQEWYGLTTIRGSAGAVPVVDDEEQSLNEHGTDVPIVDERLDPGPTVVDTADSLSSPVSPPATATRIEPLSHSGGIGHALTF